jgi:DNA-binding beta-propeller fold protein YncE
MRWVRAIGGPEDVGIRPGFWRRLLGIAEQSRFVRPSGVASARGRLLIADPGARTLWVIDEAAARLERVREVDGQPLLSPVAVSVDANGQAWLADSQRARVFALDLEGRHRFTLADPALERPAAAVYDTNRDRLYVADSAGHRVRVYTGAGGTLGSIGGRGSAPGLFNFPTHLWLGARGELLVTDALGYRIQRFDPEGRLLGSFGHHGDASGDFAAPKGVAEDLEGRVYVVDSLFDTVQVFSPEGRLLLSFGGRGTAIGRLSLPGGIAIENERIYVADAYNRRIQVYKHVATTGSP